MIGYVNGQLNSFSVILPSFSQSTSEVEGLSNTCDHLLSVASPPFPASLLDRINFGELFSTSFAFFALFFFFFFFFDSHPSLHHCIDIAVHRNLSSSLFKWSGHPATILYNLGNNHDSFPASSERSTLRTHPQWQFASIHSSAPPSRQQFSSISPPQAVLYVAFPRAC